MTGREHGQERPVPKWSTGVYLANVACETCAWSDLRDAKDVAGGRRAARNHARRNPGHRVAFDVGKSTVYGEEAPGG